MNKPDLERLGRLDAWDGVRAVVAGMGVAHAPEGRRIFSTLSVLENLQLGGYLVKDRAELAIVSDFSQQEQEAGIAYLPLFSYEIPMLIIAPGIEPGRVDTLTSQIDIAPTVLHLMGLEKPAEMTGTSRMSATLMRRFPTQV